MAMTNHLQDVFDKQIPKGKWFTADHVILIRRTDWVLKRLVEEGKLIKKNERFKVKVNPDACEHGYTNGQKNDYCICWETRAFGADE